ncbi:MAG: hypothetical protein Q7S76_01075 [bacterium]|nr:hypothetical protein [bacterium]
MIIKTHSAGGRIRYRLTSQSGQLLVEAVIAVGMVIILTTGLVVATVTSLKAAQFARMKTRATKYAQEGIELTRKLRDDGWPAFQAYGTVGGKNWCLKSDGTWVDTASCAPADFIDGIFARNVVMLWNETEGRMEATVVVRWTDTTAHTARIKSYFTEWK